MQTNYGEVTPESVREAFVKTGLKPDPSIFVLQERACGLGALVIANAGRQLYDSIDKKSGAAQAVYTLLGITMHESAPFGAGFSYAYDTSGVHAKNTSGRPDLFDLGVACRKAVADLEGLSDEN